MKSTVLFSFSLMVLGALPTSLSFADPNEEVIQSVSKNVKLDPGRVVQVVNLVNKSSVTVNLVVEDKGGSTDVSPTQRLFFSIYSKGEMFSTDAAFYLGDIYELKSAERVSGGNYRVQVVGSWDAREIVPLIIDINAEKAIQELKSIRCPDFDCDASTNFSSSITVKRVIPN